MRVANLSLLVFEATRLTFGFRYHVRCALLYLLSKNILSCWETIFWSLQRGAPEGQAEAHLRIGA